MELPRGDHPGKPTQYTRSNSIRGIAPPGKARNPGPALLTAGLAALCISALAWADARWTGEQFTVQIGSLVSTQEHRYKTDAHGRLLLAAAADQLSLEDNYLVEIHFADLPETARVALAWQTAEPEKNTFQYPFPPFNQNTVQLDMSGHPDWTGKASAILLGIGAAPHQPVRGVSIFLSSPPLSERIKRTVAGWFSFQPWTSTSVNLYVGSPTFDNGQQPAAIFASILGLLLAGYLAALWLRGKRSRFSWSTAGILVLLCWIALDLLWQRRLLLQLEATYATFAGKNSSEKLLASEEATIVEFISRASEKIQPRSSRVFLAGQQDYLAMLSAYHIAPLNTYWDRSGPEIPDPAYLASGDYILLIAPFSTAYDPARHLLQTRGGDQIAVEEALRDPVGLLLRVI